MKKIFLLLLVGLCFGAQFRYDGDLRPVQSPVGRAFPGDTITVNNYDLLSDANWTFISDFYGDTWVNQNSDVLTIAPTAVDSFVLSNLSKAEKIAIRSTNQVKIYANVLTSSVAYDIIGASSPEAIVLDAKYGTYRKLVFENSGDDTVTVNISVYKAE